MPNPEQKTSLTSKSQKFQQKVLIRIKGKEDKIEIKEFDLFPLNNPRATKPEIPNHEEMPWSEMKKRLAAVLDCQPEDIIEIEVVYKYPNSS